MTTPTVPPFDIELDPMAPPAGTGLEGWGGTLPEPVIVCLNGETITATDQGTYQQAIAFGALGACPAATPEPVVVVPVQPAGLPATGAEHVVMGGIAATLMLAGALCLRLSGYRRASCASSS